MKKIILLLIFFIIGCSNNVINSRKINFSNSDELRIMTFNIQVDFLNNWGERKFGIIDILQYHGTDIICLQEGLYSQIKYINDTFPQYGLYFVGRDDGKEKGESCAILYRKDRFIIIDKGTFWFSNTPYKVGSGGFLLIPPRICSWIEGIDKIAGRRFFIYNLHLSANFKRDRTKSLFLLVNKIEFPCIIVGDFNIRTDSIYGIFSEAFDCSYISNKSVDHILCSEEEMIIETILDNSFSGKKYPSNHRALVGTIFFKE